MSPCLTVFACQISCFLHLQWVFGPHMNDGAVVDGWLAEAIVTAAALSLLNFVQVDVVSPTPFSLTN